MKQLIHRIVTDIKFLYACIAYEESQSTEELVIVTETKLSKLYPIEKSVQGMTSMGEDYWGRYTFKKEGETKDQYYCELDGELYYKGDDFDGEPHYPVKEEINYEFPNINNALVEFKPLMDKVKEYVDENKDLNVELIESTPSLQLNSKNISESKIFCTYKFKLN